MSPLIAWSSRDVHRDVHRARRQALHAVLTLTTRRVKLKDKEVENEKEKKKDHPPKENYIIIPWIWDPLGVVSGGFLSIAQLRTSTANSLRSGVGWG